MREGPVALALAASLSAIAPAAAQPVAVAPGEWAVQGDALSQPLGDTTGDAQRGRAIVTNRQVGLCLLCHTGPFNEEPFQGKLAPTLAAWAHV